MSEVNERTQRTSLLRGPVTDIPGLTTYLAATYLPLSGGTISGELFIASGGGLYLYDASAEADVPISVDDGYLLVGGVTLLDNNSTLDASKLGVGTVPDARLSANVARRDQANTFSTDQTVSTKVRINAATVTSAGVQGANGPSVEMGFANYGIGVNSNGEPVSIINATVRNRLGVDIVVGSNGAFGIGNAAHAGENSTVDVKWVRNATGPTLETRAAGGLKVCNADGSAVAGVQCSTITAPNQLIASYQSPQFKMSGYATGVSLWGNTDVGIISNGVGVASYKFNTGMLVKSNLHVGWGSLDVNGAASTTLSQASAGVLQIGTTSNNALGSLNLTNLTASGGITFGPRTKSALLATSATATAGCWRITDDTPAQRLAYPDGTNWRYLSDDTVVT